MVNIINHMGKNLYLERVLDGQHNKKTWDRMLEYSGQQLNKQNGSEFQKLLDD